MFKNIFNVIFVISGVIPSFWRVFIKFRWHGQKLTKDPVKSAVSKEAPSKKMEESSSSDDSDDDTEMKDATDANPVDLQKKTVETKKK